jgi:hypothetical protein
LTMKPTTGFRRATPRLTLPNWSSLLEYRAISRSWRLRHRKAKCLSWGWRVVQRVIGNEPSALSVRHVPYGVWIRPSGLRLAAGPLFRCRKRFIRSATSSPLQSPRGLAALPSPVELLSQGFGPLLRQHCESTRTRLCLPRYVPSSAFLRPSTVYSSQHLVALFHATGTRGVPTLQGFSLLGEPLRVSTAVALMSVPLASQQPPTGLCSPRKVRRSEEVV